MNRRAKQVWAFFTSLKLTIVCLALLMILVVACTLAQVDLGTLGAVNGYIRSPFVWWTPAGATRSFPVFPGGALVGLVLGLNLIAAQVKRLQFTMKKAGLWIVHAGLILLFTGEFITSTMQVDSQLAIEVGESLNYVARARDLELALIDVTDPKVDDVFGIPDTRLARLPAIEIPGTPITLNVKRFYWNAALAARGPNQSSVATQGLGPEIAVTEQPPVSKEDEANRSAAIIEPTAGGKSYGTFLVAPGLTGTQSFTHDGHTWELVMRPRRQYLPYAVTLKKFSHDVYQGTDIPKNFSSLVHLSNPQTSEERDVLIFMNQPLRYDGKAFYQASFGKGDTLSVLQVVENPGWLLPYISCALVVGGLLVHFAISMQRSMRKSSAVAAVEA